MFLAFETFMSECNAYLSDIKVLKYLQMWEVYGEKFHMFILNRLCIAELRLKAVNVECVKFT